MCNPDASVAEKVSRGPAFLFHDFENFAEEFLVFLGDLFFGRRLLSFS